jgi:hypothetical protein
MTPTSRSPAASNTCTTDSGASASAATSNSAIAGLAPTCLRLLHVVDCLGVHGSAWDAPCTSLQPAFAMPVEPSACRPSPEADAPQSREDPSLRWAPGTLLRLPLWVRWVVSVIVFGALFIAFVIAVTPRAPVPRTDVRKLLEADRKTRMVIAQDQVPHTARLPRHVTARVALQRAIADDVRSRVRRGDLRGPAQGARCKPAQARGPSRRPFRCTARAGDIPYPFLGVVDLRARRITWCKRVEPTPDVAMVDVPISRRCQA